MTDLATFAAVLAVVSMLRVWIRHLPVTAPLLFVAAGVALGPDALGLLNLELTDENVVRLAELTLALVLFSDASRIDVMALRRSVGLPLRLLGIGLPLTIAMGTFITGWLLVDLRWAEAALVAAILAPTDAALGEAVVANPAVPVRIRQALNVESGLNDGLVVPVVAVFMALSAGDELEGPAALVGEAGLEVLIGVAVGAVLGWLMSVVGPVVVGRGWTDDEGLRLVAFAGAIGSFAGAEALSGNGFIAAFLCGLALRAGTGEQAEMDTELAEEVGQIGASLAFIVFGALMVVPAMEVLSFPVVVCVLGTLTLGRMIPVALALVGTGLKRPTLVFMGWFGPRGLASLLFGLLVVTDGSLQQPDDLFSVVTLAVLASVVLHGISAAPGADRYSKWFAAHGNHPEMPEAVVVPDVAATGRRLGR